MQQYLNNVTKDGKPLIGAIVTITLASGALATLYSDNGVTVRSNPMLTDAAGYFSFYAADGDYLGIITAPGIAPIKFQATLVSDSPNPPAPLFSESHPVTVTDPPYYAIGDGNYHPLSERFTTLSDAMNVYPHARALTDSQDWAAIQGALNTGRPVYLPKPPVRYMLNKELLMISAGQSLTGDAPGYGLTPNVYRSYCGLMWFGTGEKYVLTRRQPRLSAADPTDAALAVNINVQAEGVKLQGFSILLQTDFTVATDYGADWDVGVFNGCRPGFTTEDVHVVAYHRIGNYYHDVTRGNSLPEFTTPYGVTFPRSTVNSGSDGARHIRPIWSGGRWAEICFGPIRSGENYYNEQTGVASIDDRGASGASDHEITGHNIRGGRHHSGKRWVDPLSPLNNVAEGFSAGAQYMDAYAANSAGIATKRTYNGGRVVSGEVFITRIDRFGDVRFNDEHHEWVSSSIIPAAGGAQIDPRNTTLYGYGTISQTPATGTVTIVAPTANVPSDAWFWNIVPAVPDRSNKILLGSSLGEIRLSSLCVINNAGVTKTVGGLYSGDSFRLSGIDMNTLLEPAEYWVGSPINGPVGTSAVFVHVKRYMQVVIQTAIPYGGNDANSDVIYLRKRLATGTWRAWQKVTSTAA